MRFNEFKVTESAATDSLGALLTAIGSGKLPGMANATDSATSDDSTAFKMSPSSSSTGSGDSAAISNYLKSKGLDDAHRRGILVNIKAESSFNPAAYTIDTNKLPSGGLFQHNGTRFKNMVNAVGNDWKSDWQGQIDFALSEKEGRDYVATPFSSAEEATASWVKHFEKPKYASAETSARISNLKNFA